MKEMSKKWPKVWLQDMEQLEEDVAMLRQILDNLLAFLYLRRDVMNQFENINLGRQHSIKH
jgi:hypothetical protein